MILIAVILLTDCTQQKSANSDNSDNYSYDVEEKIAELGIELGDIDTKSDSDAVFVSSVRTGNLVFFTGHGPEKKDGGYMSGRLGEDLSVEEGKKAARLTAISILKSLKREIKDLNKVKRLVKVLGMVNSTSDFRDHSEVINGFSNLMIDVFGERGRHARSAVGMGSLAYNIPVEIEMIVEVEE